MIQIEKVFRSPILHYGILLLILLVATATRFHNLGTQSLWHDEGVSYGLAIRSFAESAEATSAELHPPGYFWLLHIWRIFTGDSEFAFRAVSTFAGIVSIAFAYALGKRLFHPIAGLATAILIAFNTFSIYYSQEMRMYALLALWAIASMWVFVGFFQKPGWKQAIALGLLNSAGVYTHYSFPSMMLAQGLLAILWFVASGLDISKNNGSWRNFARTFLMYVVGNLVTIALFAPWIATGWFLVGVRPQIIETVPLDQMLRAILGWFAMGRTFEEHLSGMGAVIYVFLILGLLYMPQHQEKRYAWWRLLVPVSWVLLTTGIFLWMELYMRYMRFLVPTQIAFALWIGRGVWVLFTIRTREQTGWIPYMPKFTAIFAVLVFTLNISKGLDFLYNDPEFQRNDYRAMAQRITQEMGENDAIILNAGNQHEVFLYYYDGSIPVYQLPASGDDEQALIDTQNVIENHKQIYALIWGTDEQDPNRIVETTLSDEAFQISDEWYGDVRFVRYVTPAEFSEFEQVNTKFGDAIQLEQYALSTDQLEAGDVLQLRLDWSTSKPLDTRYKVFVQLLNPDGTLATQRDSEPSAGLNITTTWQPEQVIVDNHALLIRENLPDGDYELIIGLYNLNDPIQRVPVDNQDYLSLGKIRVESD